MNALRLSRAALLCVALAILGGCNAHAFRVVDDAPVATGLSHYRSAAVEVTTADSALKATPADERFLGEDLALRLRKEGIFADVRPNVASADVLLRVRIVALGWARAEGVSSDTPAEAKVAVTLVDAKTQKSLGAFTVIAKRGGVSPEADDNRALQEAMRNASRGIVERLRRQR